MKKLLSFISIFVLSIIVVGCSGSKNPEIVVNNLEIGTQLNDRVAFIDYKFNNVDEKLFKVSVVHYYNGKELSREVLDEIFSSDDIKVSITDNSKRIDAKDNKASEVYLDYFYNVGGAIYNKNLKFKLNKEGNNVDYSRIVSHELYEDEKIAIISYVTNNSANNEEENMELYREYDNPNYKGDIIAVVLEPIK